MSLKNLDPQVRSHTGEGLDPSHATTDLLGAASVMGTVEFPKPWKDCNTSVFNPNASGKEQFPVTD